MRGLKQLADSANEKKWLLAPGWCGIIRTTWFCFTTVYFV